MSTDLETPPLEGIIWEGTPPCDCILASGLICGKPSAVRIMSNCEGCKKIIHGWACAPCWKCIRPYVMFQDFTCAYCRAPRMVWEI